MSRNARFSSNLADISQEEPSTVAKARQKRTSTGPTSVVGKDKNTAVKKKPTSQKSATAKKTKRSSTYQQLKEAQRGWQDSTTENDPQDNEEDNDGADPQDNEEGSEGADPPANHFFFEGDAGYEEAFQAARRRHVSRAPPRRPFTTTPLTNRPVHDDSDFETPADADIDGSTQVAEAPPSETTIAPQEPASPAHPSDQSTPAPRRQIINPLTRQSRRGRHVRPGALSGYETRPVGDRGSPERSSRAAPSDIGVIEDDDGHASPTRLSYAASLGLPVASGNRPPRNFYCPFPEGSRSHYTDDSDTPTHVTHPTPSGGSRVSFTANQREAAQAAQANTSQPARAGQDAQPVSQSSPVYRKNTPLILIQLDRPLRTPPTPQAVSATSQPTAK